MEDILTKKINDQKKAPDNFIEASGLRDKSIKDEAIFNMGVQPFLQARKDLEYKEPGYPSSIKIKDNRTIRATTGKAIVPTRDLKTGYYDTDNIHAIIRQAKLNDVDPYIALGVSMAETNLGTTDEYLGHTTYDTKDTPDFHEFRKDYNNYYEAMRNHKAKTMVDMIKEKAKEARSKGYTSQEHQLQFYNGKKLTATTESEYHMMTGRGATQKSWYGVPIPKEGYIDLMKNPLYGKEVLDMVKILKDNDDIKIMVDTVLNQRGIYKK